MPPYRARAIAKLNEPSNINIFFFFRGWKISLNAAKSVFGLGTGTSPVAFGAMWFPYTVFFCEGLEVMDQPTTVPLLTPAP